tara:strand:+ start:1137 stop:1337 length:201 start_codon:yes stop_codon:yes gene_type:complete
MIRPTSKPDVNKIAMKVNRLTGVGPISLKFHHFIVQKITNANASNIPNEMIDVIIISPSLVPVLGH